MIHSSRHLLALIAVALAPACTEPSPPWSDAGITPTRSPRGVRIHGLSRILVIPAKFAGGQPEPIDGTGIRNQFFKDARGGLGPVGEAFRLASSGSFYLQGEVTNWIQSSVRRDELTAVGVDAPTREGDYVLEAIRAVDGMVDFGRYDNDGPDGFPNSGDDDGIVDGGIVVLNSDRNTTCDTAAAGLHPHAILGWRDKKGVRFRTADVHRTVTDSAPRGIEVGGYVAMGVLSCALDVGANVMTHELAHLLFGLPDLYHVVGGGAQIWEGRRWVVGCWDLMAAGSGWGCGSGLRAGNGLDMSTLGAWSRVQVGWSTPIEARIDLDTVYTLFPPGHGATVLKLAVSDSEYFLVEYRERGEVDRMPPAPAGVLIYHIDRRLPIVPSDTAVRRYRIRLVEADAGDELIRTDAEGGNRGTASDAFGISRTSFATGAHPGAMTTAGAPLPFSITEITIDVANHQARVRIRPG